MASKLVSSATSDKLAEVDWTKNIEICELVARDHGQAKDVVKIIKKRLGSKHSNTQLYAVTLLEMLMNNIGDPVHKQVVDTGVLPILVKIVKKKSELPVREKIFLLLDAAQTSVGGGSGRFPQYYASYYELVKAGVKFTSNVNKNSPPDKGVTAPQPERNTQAAPTQVVPESSIFQKASTALEVLRDVLNTIDTQHPQAAKDEFTLDLVEQCSFQKQRVMHLAITSRDERVVSRAVELNEQLERVLRRHDDFVAGRTMTTRNDLVHEEDEEEEEAEQLFRRMRKGKACVQAEDEDDRIDRPLGLMGWPIPGEIIHRPLIRPLTVDHQREPIRSPNTEPKHETIRSLALGMNHEEANIGHPSVAIPPPPAKHIEREKYFQESKTGDGNTLHGHMRNLSLHSRNASSSRSGSTDFSD